MIGATATDTVISAAGWTLIHFIWQGTVIGALFFGVMPLMRNASATVRYWLGMLALGAMLVCAITTFCFFLGSPPGPAARPAELSVAGQAVATFGATGLSAAIEQRIELWLPWAVVAWLSGVLVISGRLVLDYLRVRRLCFEGVRPLRPELQSVVDRLANSLGLCCVVRVLESTRVAVPLVVGWIRPVILVPPSALMGLSPLQLELIISHELAHVKRLDYLFNLLQIVVETLLFYHPAVRAISIRVRRERENCCDDVVVARTGDSVTYARALTEVEGLRCSPGTRLTMGATGGQLGGRVRRLVATPSDQRGAVDWAGGATMLLGSVGVSLLGASWVSDDSADHVATLTVMDSPPVIARYADPASPPPGPPIHVALAAQPPSAGPIEPPASHREAATRPREISKLVPGGKTPAVAPDETAPSDTATVEAGHAARLPATARPQASVPPPSPEHLADSSTPAASGVPAGTHSVPVAAAVVVPGKAAIQSAAIPARAGSPGAGLPSISRTTPEAETTPHMPSPIAQAADPAPAGPPTGQAEGTISVARERITGGRLLDARQPSYPRRARINGKMGVVTVVFDVNEDGGMGDVAIVDSTARIFERPVLKAVKKWRYEPFLLDGEPVRARVTHTFQFELETDQSPMTEEDGRCKKVTGSRLCRSRAAYDDLGVVVVYNNTLD